ncbi:hypothetical protein Pmani_011175 [Petrolisthes manimaculis]|uniref:Reverse transcriptase n=1 Tax=Petrolisthes manimaculis TaxID=1843537 RepID=A0AAE1UBS6_9EUCA|nr:hypothetical protein Pmani_011175 [Petrolisthes manimaculis]
MEETESSTIRTNVKLCNSEILANLSQILQHLPSDHACDLEKLLKTFPQICSDVPQQCRLVEHDIVLVEGAQPVKQAFYRMSSTKRKILQEEIDYMLAHDLVERSDSPWSSPCLLIPKPDGSYRMCTDYRKINRLTVPDCYPLPRIDDIIDNLDHVKFVTTIDLLRGYYQPYNLIIKHIKGKDNVIEDMLSRV